MSIQQNFPAISPSLSLNFARSKTLDPRITFSRSQTTSNGSSYMDENGLIRYAGPDEPRFDHKYENGVVKSLGLLIEESRITYQTYTEDPTQWNTANMVPTGNSVTLPTGEVSTTIEYKGETTDANSKFIRPTVSGTEFNAGDTWTYSGFYKKGVTNGERYVHIILQNNTSSEGTGRRFDFDTGTWASTQSNNGGTTVDSGYEEHPNGWYRIWMTCTFPSASNVVQTFTRLHTNSASIPYDTSFSLWGAQLEKASFMTSYIPNDTGSQKTRNPDNVSITGTNFTDWYNTSEGTFVTLHRQNDANDTTSNYGIYSLSNSPVNNDRLRFFAGSSRSPVFNTVISNNTNAYVNAGSLLGINFLGREGELIKCSTRYSDVDCSIVIEGSDLATDNTDIVIPSTLNNMIIGAGGGGLKQLCGHISQLTYYPRRLTNEQLQNLTK